MNERIKELIEQAEIKFESHPQHQGIDTAVIIPTDLEKFAELIVGECINLCSDEWNGDADTYEASNAYNECADLIKEHFGVEG